MSAKETFHAFFPDWFTGIVKAVIVVVLIQACSVLMTSVESSSLFEAILTLGTYGLVSFLLLHVLKHVRLTGDGTLDKKEEIRSEYDHLIMRFFVIPVIVIAVSAMIVIFLFGASPGSAAQFGLAGMGIIMTLIAIAM